MLYGTVLLRERKRPEAAAAAAAAIALDGNSARAHLLAGDVHSQSDRTEDAISEFEKVLALDTRALGAALQLSRLHLLAGRSDKSLTYAQQALSIAPGSPDAQGLLVRTYLAQNDQAKAAAIVATLQNQYPNSPELHNLSALIQLARKDVAGARNSYERALGLAPSNLEALAGAVRLDIATGRRQDAIARLDAVAQTGAGVDVLLTLARGYASVGDAPKAEAALKRAIETDPGRLQAYVLLGGLYAAQKRLADARAQFENVVKQNPRSVPAHTMIGMLLEAEGKSTEAEHAYQQALAVDARAAVAANNLAWIYVASDRQLEDALQLAQVASEQLHQEPAVNDTLGWVFVKKDMAGRAIPFLETAAKADPSNAEFRYHLGTAYYKSGDWPKARRELEAGLKLQPTSPLAADATSTLAIIGASASKT